MLLFLAVACAPEEVETATPVRVTPVDTAPEFKEIETLTVAAQFGYDPASGTAVATVFEGTSLPPTFEILLGPPRWNGDTRSGLHCSVYYDLTGLPVVPTEGSFLSITIPGDTPTTTDCEDLDPELWGEDPSEAFRPATLGVQVTALPTAVRDWLADQSAELDYFAGAAFQVEAIFGEDSDFGYTNVFETDASLTLQLDGDDAPIRITGTALESTPPVGWYSVNSGTLWTLQ